MNFWLAPYYALFSRPFYRGISRSPEHKGLLYLLYLCFGITVVFLTVLTTRIIPQADLFVEWIKKEMPIMELTGKGLTTDRAGRVTMVHPDFGPVAVFDLSKSEAAAEETQQALLFVTQTKIYYTQGAQTRVLDLSETIRQAAQNPGVKIVLDAAAVDRVYGAGKKLVIVVGLIAGYFIIVLWKLFSMLIYSLPALAFNRNRVHPLSYGKQLDLVCYALTPAALLQVIRWLIPSLAEIPYIGILDVMITLSYLYLAVKMTDEAPAVPKM